MSSFASQGISLTPQLCCCIQTGMGNEILFRNAETWIFYLCIYLFFRAAPLVYGIPRLQVKSELQLLAYTTATAMPDLSHVCSLHSSSWQCRILNPLSRARDQTNGLMDTSWVLNLLSHCGNSIHSLLNVFSPAQALLLLPFPGHSSPQLPRPLLNS